MAVMIYVGDEHERIRLPMMPDELVRLVGDREVMSGTSSIYKKDIRRGDDPEEINVFAMAVDYADGYAIDAVEGYEDNQYSLGYLEIANWLYQSDELPYSRCTLAEFGEELMSNCDCDLYKALVDHDCTNYFDFAEYAKGDDVAETEYGVLRLYDDFPDDSLYDLHELAAEYDYPYEEEDEDE